jgi:hypothetical protein
VTPIGNKRQQLKHRISHATLSRVPGETVDRLKHRGPDDAIPIRTGTQIKRRPNFARDLKDDATPGRGFKAIADTTFAKPKRRLPRRDIQSGQRRKVVCDGKANLHVRAGRNSTDQGRQSQLHALDSHETPASTRLREG